MKDIKLALMMFALWMLAGCQSTQSLHTAKALNELEVSLQQANYTQVQAIAEKAQQGDAKAQFEMGYLSIIEAFPENTYLDAFDWIMASAQQGYAHAQYYAGLFYLDDEIAPPDLTSAQYWLELAAAQQHTPAMYELATLYSYFRPQMGLPMDSEKTIYWLKQAAALNLVDAQYDLARFYLYGVHGLEKNHAQAMHWIAKLQQIQDPRGNYLLGLDHYLGLTQAVNEQAGLKYLHLSADQDYAPAQYDLALHYFEHHEPQIAFNWATRAAQSQDPDALLMLGRFYFSGTSVEVDRAKALSLFHQAADLGLPEAQTLVVLFDLENAKTSEQKRAAVERLRQQAKAHNPHAQEEMMLLYFTQDPKHASDAEQFVSLEHAFMWAVILKQHPDFSEMSERSRQKLTAAIKRFNRQITLSRIATLIDTANICVISNYQKCPL
ncbi:hypothetical protein VST7929_03156 [Vibrio stylophorae]|uniref:Sel1 repeat family protein n=1 Tax=Vibrio stylophorae TaxID=659351 RepID=A0ABM8ZY76_9VIBR|nr:hypothetical protein [Vibrio stylophorae]CAH0535642.1 hypothetical protein VST7929_03156 [Vibrio stylophorae]